MTGSRSSCTHCIFHPNAGRFHGARDLQKYKELLRISVLSFIENDAVIIFADALHYIRKPHEIFGERHLVRVLDEAALESELAVIALHFGSDTKSARIDPVTKRSKRIPPDPHEFFRRCGARWPGDKFFSVAPAFFPPF